MKRVFLLATLVFCLLPLSSKAAVKADASELYIKIFDTIMAADNLQSSGQGRKALEKYLEAERDLKNLKSAYKDWNPRIVNFRLKYLADKIGPLKVQYPGTVIPDKKASGGSKAKGGKKGKKVSGVDAMLEQLNDQLVELSKENAKLRDQLREALAARPAPSDPAAYAKAQSRIRELEQTTDVSTVTISQQEAELKRLREDYAKLQRRLAAMEARADEPRLRSENERLKAQVAALQAQTRGMPDVDEMNRRISLLETDLKSAEAKALSLAQENQALKQQMATTDLDSLRQQNAALLKQVNELSKIAGTIDKVEAVEQKLAAAQAELKAQQSLNAELTRLNKELEDKIRNDPSPKLRAENQVLKDEISKLKRLTASMPSIEKLQNDLAAAQAKVQAEQALRATLLREKEKLETLLTDPNTQIGKGAPPEVKALESEKKALEAQLKELAAESRKNAEKAATLNQQFTAQSARLQQLERERVELQKALEKALKDLEAQKRSAGKAAEAKPAAQTAPAKKKRQVTEARLRAQEARSQAYTDEELARLRASALPAPKPVASKPAPKPAPQPARQPEPVQKPQPQPRAATQAEPVRQPKREFPASAAQIALEAQQAYNARRYDEAEEKYKQVLSVEENNVYTLANLAAAQMELNKLAEAEANLKRALSIEKNDAFSMALLGLIKFRKNDYDGALQLLSRAAELDPDNAQTQNYLGLALSQKGMRIAAEAAFRRAVKLAPGYSVAHYNLSVFYATGEPPSPELARWHYQKALSAGHPKSPELEKLLVTR